MSPVCRLLPRRDTDRKCERTEKTGALNLFFCFRWILCSFKRELSFEGTLALWEILWTDHYGTHFHLFFALAIIQAHRDVIIRYLREFDEVSTLTLCYGKGY